MPRPAIVATALPHHTQIVPTNYGPIAEIPQVEGFRSPSKALLPLLLDREDWEIIGRIMGWLPTVEPIEPVIVPRRRIVRLGG